MRGLLLSSLLSNPLSKLVSWSLSLSIIIRSLRLLLSLLLLGHCCPSFFIYQVIMPAPGRLCSFSDGKTEEISSCAFCIVPVHCCIIVSTTHRLNITEFCLYQLAVTIYITSLTLDDPIQCKMVNLIGERERERERDLFFASSTRVGA